MSPELRSRLRLRGISGHEGLSATHHPSNCVEECPYSSNHVSCSFRILQYPPIMRSLGRNMIRHVSRSAQLAFACTHTVFHIQGFRRPNEAFIRNGTVRQPALDNKKYTYTKSLPEAFVKSRYTSSMQSFRYTTIRPDNRFRLWVRSSYC